MIIDILIVGFAISAVIRGKDIGFVRQLFSTCGFIGGLFLGALLQPYTLLLVHSASSRTIMTLATTLGSALILLTLGEFVGLLLKYRVVHWSYEFNRLDNWFGSGLSVVTLLLSVWLVSAVVNSLPYPNIQSYLEGSRIISALNKVLPSAPTALADIGRLIDPNGFPEVFVGAEPSLNSNVSLPSLGDLQAAVTKDQASVVKVEGQGCGGIVEGSGFVVGPDEVATNAHVVAGIKHPYVIDSNGTHSATAIWFDPNLDFAVLVVNHLTGGPLTITNADVPDGTKAAVLGYPGGGSFNAGAAAISNDFKASGRNIYGTGSTLRDVYAVQATVIPGNSGGPLVDESGNVIGIVFAESTSYNHVGYALTTPPVVKAIASAVSRDQATSTGQCAD